MMCAPSPCSAPMDIPDSPCVVGMDEAWTRQLVDLDSSFNSFDGNCGSFGMDEAWTKQLSLLELPSAVVADQAVGGSMAEDEKPPPLPTVFPRMKVVSANGLSKEFITPSAPHAVQLISNSIDQEFGLDGRAFVLRHMGEGWVTKLMAGMPPSSYRLEIPTGCQTNAVSAELRHQPLAFAMAPPSGACEWLATCVDKGGVCRPAQHTFYPAPSIVVTDNTVDAVALANGRWSLWSPQWVDVSHLLHAGSCEIGTDTAGRPVAEWSGMGITEISATVKDTGVDGWFHLSFSLQDSDAKDGEPLVLQDSVTGAASRIVIKHSRCEGMGRWRTRGSGPYATHADCLACGSHVGARGEVLCKPSKTQQPPEQQPQPACPWWAQHCSPPKACSPSTQPPPPVAWAIPIAASGCAAA